jgi:hypothetical protein
MGYITILAVEFGGTGRWKTKNARKGIEMV